MLVSIYCYSILSEVGYGKGDVFPSVDNNKFALPSVDNKMCIRQ